TVLSLFFSSMSMASNKARAHREYQRSYSS
ncbi:hypothetical protein CP8484711_0764B, partial [Chlamydia psittaci 84-8471/1]